MNPAVQAVICGKKLIQVTKTFTANATWTAPNTTSRVDASGKGAAGSPSSSYNTYNESRIVYRVRRDGGQDSFPESGGSDIVGSTPDSYCESFVSTPSDPTYSGYSICHYYSGHSNTSPPITGASTTAFSKTFPGGTGGAATVTTFIGVVVTPGANYNIVVPTGGSLTITYYQ